MVSVARLIMPRKPPCHGAVHHAAKHRDQLTGCRNTASPPRPVRSPPRSVVAHLAIWTARQIVAGECRILQPSLQFGLVGPIPLGPALQVLFGRQVIGLGVVATAVGQDEFLSEIDGVTRPR